MSRCTESESGGRMIDAILTNSMLPEISRKFLRGVVDRKRTERLDIRVEDSALVYSFL